MEIFLCFVWFVIVIIVGVLICLQVLFIVGIICHTIFLSLFEDIEIRDYLQWFRRCFKAIKEWIETRKLKRLERRRAKIEKERLRQEELKQPEYFKNCERFVNDFWQDFLEDTEDTKVLLSRLKARLENSGYFNWQQDFYADVEKRAKETSRPSQEQRQKAFRKKNNQSFGDIKIDFNGVFVTPTQYQILCQNSKTRNLSRAQVLELCRKLAETRPEFASFKEEQSIQPYVRQEETNEAFKLFGLTSETLTVESLKQAYRRLVQQYHPDRNKEANAAEMFQKVQRYHAYLEGLARG